MVPATDFLETIIAQKRRRLEAAKAVVPEADLQRQARHHSRRRRALTTAINQNAGLSVIAEYKRASPSKGLIRSDVDPASMARSYEAGGAVAVSVLTEEDHFQGSLEDLRTIREAVSLPVLRKDFIFDRYQVYETAAAGAAALLLIVAALSDDALADLRTLAEEELGLDALVEVHSITEMDRARAAGATLIGVNNRNLRTFVVSLETSKALAERSWPGVTLISESGLRAHADLRLLDELGYRGFLVGESLMRASQPELALRALIEGS
jgi:indole-3-glycerol phosphate synthase